MGFYATTCPEVEDLPLKNRVGGFRRSSPLRAGRFAPQPFETVSETAVTFTITVSGLSFWLSRDPIGEEVVVRQLMRGKSIWEQIRLRRLSYQTQPYLFVSNDPQDKFDSLGLWPWSKYIEEGQTNGSTKITIKKPCVIVILFGHGLNTKPHTFVFEKPCTAGGFVGCDAGSTNTKIPGDNQSDDLKMTDGELHLGAGSSSYPQEEQFQYWLDKAKAGAKTKAKAICKKKDCCCKEVYIYGELAGSAWNMDNWAFPGGWSETVKCDEVP